MFTKVLVLAVAALCVHADPDELSWRPSCDGKSSGTLFPNPYNCTVFFKCDNGYARTELCPTGLHFNVKIGTCDWPENAQCTTVQQLEEQITEIERVNIDEISPDQTAFWLRLYCSSTRTWTLQLPNVWDCSSFWLCGHRSAQLMKCPAGLEYNRFKLICDYPENARCIPQPKP